MRLKIRIILRIVVMMIKVKEIIGNYRNNE